MASIYDLPKLPQGSNRYTGQSNIGREPSITVEARRKAFVVLDNKVAFTVERYRWREDSTVGNDDRYSYQLVAYGKGTGYGADWTKGKDAGNENTASARHTTAVSDEKPTLGTRLGATPGKYVLTADTDRTGVYEEELAHIFNLLDGGRTGEQP